MGRERGSTLTTRPISMAMVMVCAAMFATHADAQTQTVKHDVTALGFSEQEAVLNALQEATFQICGVRVGTTTTETNALLIEDDSGTKIVEEVNRQIEVRGRNPNCGFDGYDILSLEHDGAQHRASVTGSDTRCTRCRDRQ